MADFTLSLRLTLKNEGHYSFNEIDRGGETYCGISRKSHPLWPGWQIIDTINAEERSSLDQVVVRKLSTHLDNFYYTEFWTRLHGDEIISQAVANVVFDIAVNMGISTSVKFLQRACNSLGTNLKASDLVIDGIIGDRTIERVNYLTTKVENLYVLVKMLLFQQGMRYMDIMDKDHSQRIFCRGWINRVKYNEQVI